MKEIDGDIFDYLEDKSVDAICIFTNGIVNSKGFAMAGAGQAGHASQLWENFRKLLGSHISEYGNVTGVIGRVENNKLVRFGKSGPYIINFPTKEHFMKSSIPELIQKSATKLTQISEALNLSKVVMGRPGCGTYTGRLDWNDTVKPLIEKILDDRYLIVNYAKEIK